MPEALLIALGAALGGMARMGVAAAVAARLGERFPWGILAVNLSGALGIGVLAGLLLAGTGGAAWQHPGAQFAVAGFLGSYTTVSSFSLQTLALAHDRRWARAAANVAASLGGCLVAVALGFAAGAWAAGAPG